MIFLNTFTQISEGDEVSTKNSDQLLQGEAELAIGVVGPEGRGKRFRIVLYSTEKIKGKDAGDIQ